MTGRTLATAQRALGRAGERSLPLAFLLGGLAFAAWVMLWLWSASPYARYVQHDGWIAAGAFAALCRAIPEGGAVAAMLHALAWVLMIAAMMLPTTMPVVALFRRITGGRTDAMRLTTLVLLGFFIAWLAFGLVAHAADLALRRTALSSPAFVTHGYLVGAAVLAGAGLFQFSALKYRCLERCHTPFAFVAARWHGRAPAREAFRLGLDHGLFCVGCCWALMLLMFVVGTGSLGWMLALALVMAAEKNLPWGRRLRVPLGVGLLGWSAAVVASRL